MTLTLAPISLRQWDALVDHLPDARLFHTSAWLNLLADVYGTPWQPLGIHWNGALAGLLPLQTRRLGPFRLAGSPLMQAIASTPTLGPIGPALLPNALPELFAALDGYLRGNRIAHVELAFTGLIDSRPLLARGYHVEEREAVVLCLRGATRESLWQGLTPSSRRAVRKAETSGIEVEEAVTGDFLPAYFGLCQEVYRIAGRPPHLSLRFYTALWERLAGSGSVRALLVRRSGDLVAGALFLEHRGIAWYLSGASSAAAEPLRPNNLIQWRYIEQAHARGLHHYDMGGATVGGITRFKLGFGATMQPYTRAWRTLSPAASWGRRVYQGTLPAWRRLAQRTHR